MSSKAESHLLGVTYSLRVTNGTNGDKKIVSSGEMLLITFFSISHAKITNVYSTCDEETHQEKALQKGKKNHRSDLYRRDFNTQLAKNFR